METDNSGNYFSVGFSVRNAYSRFAPAIVYLTENRRPTWKGKLRDILCALVNCSFNFVQAVRLILVQA